MEEASLKSLVFGIHMGNMTCRKSPNVTSAEYKRQARVTVSSNEKLGVLNVIA